MPRPNTLRSLLAITCFLLLAAEGKRAEPARDSVGDPLPAGAGARLGSARLWHAEVSAIRFSPDGKELATLGVFPKPDDASVSTIRWWDAANGRFLRERSFPEHPLTAWAPSPDGRQLALGVSDKHGRRIALWDIAKGKEIAGPLMTHVWQITFLNYLADGKTLVSRDDSDRSFHFWDLATRKEIKGARPILPQKKFSTRNASALSEDGKRSAWHVRTFAEDAAGRAGRLDGELIQVVEGGKVLWQKEGRFNSRVAVALSPDGKLFAWAYGYPHVIDVASKKTLAEFPIESARAEALAFSPDGKTLACQTTEPGGIIRVHLWDVQERKKRCSILASPHSWKWNVPIAFTRDSQSVALAGDGPTRIVEAATGKERVSLPSGHRLPVTELSFAPDRNSLHSGDEVSVYRWAGGKSGQPLFSSSPQIRKRSDASDRFGDRSSRSDGRDPIYSLDRTLALDQDYQLFELSPSQLQRRCKLQVEKDASYWLTKISPDNRRVLLTRYQMEGDDEQKIMGDEIFDSGTGKRVGSWACSQSIQSTFSPDGQLFVRQDEKGRIHLGDLRSAKEVQLLSTDLSRKPPRAWPTSPGSNVFVGAGDPYRFDRLVVSPDNQRVAAAWNSNLSAEARPGQLMAVGDDKEPTTLYVWEVAGGKEIGRIAFPATKGKWPQITCLAFLRDGRTLAASYLGDADVHLIEIASGREQAVLRGHRGAVRSLALSPEGRYLLSGSDDTTILVWDVDSLPAAVSTPDGSPLPPKERGRLWESLADADADAAFRAMQTLRSHPEQAVALLREHVQRIAEVEPKRIQRWIADLDSGEFAVREVAQQELARLGELAEPALRQAVAKPPSLEVRMRIERLLEPLMPRTLTGQRLRQVRCVEVLEAIGSPAARQHLEKLAEGAGVTRLTQEAKESLRRLRAMR